MYDRAGCEILKARRVGGGKLERQEREREENKKTQSNEIFTSFWINTWTLLTSQLHGRGGKRNVEGQKEQWSFTVTVKGAERLAVPQGVTLSLWASWCSWGSLLWGPPTWLLSLAQKKRKFSMMNVKMRLCFTSIETWTTPCSPQPRASSEDSLRAVLPNGWKISAIFFGVSVVLCREAQCKQITKEWTWVFIFSLFSHSAQQCPKGKVTPCAGGVRGVSTPPGCAAGARDTLQHPQIAHTSAPAPISHVMFETSNILSLLINTAIMACQGFMLYPK